MSRSGYVDDGEQWDLIKWRGQVASAMRGKRGQAFLLEMWRAMQALPERKLIANDLEADGAVCAIGAVGKARGVDMSRLDPDDYEGVAATFGIPHQLAQEIVYMNDEQFHGRSVEAEGPNRWGRAGVWTYVPYTPEERFEKMKKWIESALLPVEDNAAEAHA